MIEQAPRCADDDVDAAAERVLLRAHPDAAEQGDGWTDRWIVYGKVNGEEFTSPSN
jgi:hypothetical protein